MNTDIQIVSMNDENVRTVTIYDTKLFACIDVAKALGYRNHSQAVISHVHPGSITYLRIPDTRGRVCRTKMSDEEGITQLVSKSSFGLSLMKPTTHMLETSVSEVSNVSNVSNVSGVSEVSISNDSVPDDMDLRQELDDIKSTMNELLAFFNRTFRG